MKRIWAIFLRYFYVSTKLDQISDLFYWPAIDIFLWGMTMSWVQTHENQIPNIILVVLTGLIFWGIVWRSNYEIAINPLYEFWNRNLVNLFSTPLTLVEWLTGVILLSCLKILVSLAFGSLLVFVLYETNVFSIGWAFFPFALSVIITGWIFGLLSGAVVIYWGQRFQMLAWMVPYIFAPFSAVLYPVAALPTWAQPIAWSLPTTYVFEGIRHILTEHIFPAKYFWISMGLNAIYFFLALALFKLAFELSRAKGLARLE
jgi:ABC-2 type transport system permease protein